MEPVEVARRYIELFNAERFREMGELFAEDALWQPGAGGQTRGRAGIIAGYVAMEGTTGGVRFTDARYYVDGQVVAAEIVVRHPSGGTSGVVDVFQIDADGRIARMSAYPSPNRDA